MKVESWHVNDIDRTFDEVMDRIFSLLDDTVWFLWTAIRSLGLTTLASIWPAKPQQERRFASPV